MLYKIALWDKTYKMQVTYQMEGVTKEEAVQKAITRHMRENSNIARPKLLACTYIEEGEVQSRL